MTISSSSACAPTSPSRPNRPRRGRAPTTSSTAPWPWSLKGREDGFALAANQCADVFAIKIEQAGGLLRARDLIGIAQAADIALYGGTMLEGSISTLAAAHLFATVDKLEWGTEMFGPLLLQDDILVERLDYSDFTLKLPKGPGLGVALDEDKVRHYTRK